MNLDKSTTDLISILGFTLQSGQTLMQAYSFFHLENISNFAQLLLNHKKELSIIKSDDVLKHDFLAILDKVAHESELDKLEHWKNAVLRLATDFRDFPFKNNFIKIIQNLTVFDLTVLTKIYSTDFSNEHFEEELIKFFIAKHAPKQIVIHSLKSLASYNLVSEVSNRAIADVAIGSEFKLSPLYYIKNDLGTEFIEFITNDFMDISK